MPILMVDGKRKLEGKIKISGAKNSVLPLMASCLLTEETITLTNVPDITDVEVMIKTLKGYGVKIVLDDSDKCNRILRLTAGKNPKSSPSTNAGSDIRAGFLVLGPLLARKRDAVCVYRPGGCKIAQKGRNVDFHIQAMEKLGARLIQKNEKIIQMEAETVLHPKKIITFKNSSVGATENAMMAACLVNGKTVIRNAAIEPEITCDLVEILTKMGARITIETDVLIVEDIEQHGITEYKENWNVITIRGRETLTGATQEVMPDRIEFGTYAIAAAITNGKILLEVEKKWKPIMLEAIEEKLIKAEVKIKDVSQDRRCRIEISLENGRIKPVDIKTGPYPLFPTDLLPQWVTFMTQAQPGSGKSYTTVKERVFDNRFMYVDDLMQMGAKIQKTKDTENSTLWEYRIQAKGGIHAGRTASLKGTRVTAPDLRGGAALVLAGLVAEGSTAVREYEHVMRGYEDMAGKLKKCKGKLNVEKDARPGHSGASSEVF